MGADYFPIIVILPKEEGYSFCAVHLFICFSVRIYFLLFSWSNAKKLYTCIFYENLQTYSFIFTNECLFIKKLGFL